jgi:hypothetical protein
MIGQSRWEISHILHWLTTGKWEALLIVLPSNNGNQSYSAINSWIDFTIFIGTPLLSIVLLTDYKYELSLNMNK